MTPPSLSFRFPSLLTLPWPDTSLLIPFSTARHQQISTPSLPVFCESLFPPSSFPSTCSSAPSEIQRLFLD
ncbi:Uncharacterized protein HZ326_3897 [Fusarium oxysporum f. sp. albedinis]|nr:Uncharacterized protein HZ326_3897 [Fusarium oxysporum f. sp. albedinis]